MKTFMFFTSVNHWIPKQDLQTIHTRWHEVLIKYAEVEKDLFPFFWIKFIPELVIFKEDITIEHFSPYQWIESIESFI